MKGPIFLTLAEVLEIHRSQIERYGGLDGVRDMGLIESSLAMPQSSFGGHFLHSSLFEMAAAYAYHISENQRFLDGNKRTGLGAALIFLEMNGISINDPRCNLYDAMMKIGNRQMSKQEFGKLLESVAQGRRKPKTT